MMRQNSKKKSDMILSDREIQAALVREAVVITPTPAAKAWSSTAVDLTLDKELRKWKPKFERGKPSPFVQAGRPESSRSKH